MVNEVITELHMHIYNIYTDKDTHMQIDTPVHMCAKPNTVNSALQAATFFRALTPFAQSDAVYLWVFWPPHSPHRDK